MRTNKSSAIWKGTLKQGNGSMRLDSVGKEINFNFSSRFEKNAGTNPEELIAAAHAGCFSMALSALLSENGYEPNSISTVAEVTIDQQGDSYSITESTLTTKADVPKIEEPLFLKLAEAAKNNCPVSKALSSSVNVNLIAELINKDVYAH